MKLFLLYENAAGLALFRYKKFKESKQTVEEVIALFTDEKKFMKKVKLVAFKSFQDSQIALDTQMNINDGKMTDFLENFLKSNLPEDEKFGLAVQERILGQTLNTKYGYACKTGKVVFEFFRSIRALFSLYTEVKHENIDAAQLGLTHVYSRHRISEDVEKQDKHILQATALIAQMEKNLNLFTMRIKEWYGWHFPELAKIVQDNKIYIDCLYMIKDKDTLSEEHLEALEDLVKSSDMAQSILEASRSSVGQPNNDVDMNQIIAFATRVKQQYELLENLNIYLKDRMMKVAPNFTALIGEKVGAKLLTKAGSLVTLAKYPASTIQILGAEKALFRAMNSGGNTPKYGILYGSPFIGRATPKDRGKISRYIANKCALACRLDQYQIKRTSKFGEKMKAQVEARLNFLATGETTQKNVDAMKEVLEELKSENLYFDTEAGQKGEGTDTQDSDDDKKEKKKKKKSKKRKATVDLEEEAEEKPKKKKKKSKKDKKKKKKKSKKEVTA